MPPPAVSERPSGGVRIGSPKWLTNLLASIALMLFGGLVAGPLVGWFERSNASVALERLERKIERYQRSADEWRSVHDAKPGHDRMDERFKGLDERYKGLIAREDRSDAKQSEIIRRLASIEKKLQ